MTDHEAGYLHALSEIHCEIWRMAQDSSLSSDARLELLNVLSFVDDRIRRESGRHGEGADLGGANENRRDAEE